MRTRRPTRSAGIAVALLLLAGCGSQPGTDEAAATGAATASSAVASDAAATSAAASTTATGDAAASTGDAGAPPFPADTSPDVADAVDPAGLTVTGVRAGRHEGYDRIVFDLAGSGTPGWRVEYVDAPSAEGSGDPVDVPGRAFLHVSLQGTSYPYETGAEEVSRGAVTVPGIGGLRDVEGVVYDGTFEGVSVAFIGTTAETPFRVYALTGPSRVVVEVADPR